MGSHSESEVAKSNRQQQRLLSLDAYRGLIMVSPAFKGFGLRETAENHLAEGTTRRGQSPFLRLEVSTAAVTGLTAPGGPLLGVTSHSVGMRSASAPACCTSSATHIRSPRIPSTNSSRVTSSVPDSRTDL